MTPIAREGWGDREICRPPLTFLLRLSLQSRCRRRSCSRSSRELHALTGLRFFAAFSVVIYHFTAPLVEGWPKPAVNLAAGGCVAVSLFFLLSGFVLSYSYLGREGKLRGSRRSFWVARVARIYPAYLLGFLLAAPTNFLWTVKVNAAKAAAVKLAVGGSLVLAMLQAWTPWTAWYWNFPAWSISVEAFFYLSFPFLPGDYRALPAPDVSTSCWPLTFSLSSLPHYSTSRSTFGPPDVGDHLQMAIEFNPLLRLPEFVMGMFARPALCYRSSVDARNKPYALLFVDRGHSVNTGVFFQHSACVSRERTACPAICSTHLCTGRTAKGSLQSFSPCVR